MPKKSEFVVQNIVDRKINGNSIFFKVKWLGWSESCNTWEPYEHICHIVQIMKAFQENFKIGRQAYLRAVENIKANQKRKNQKKKQVLKNKEPMHQLIQNTIDLVQNEDQPMIFPELASSTEPRIKKRQSIQEPTRQLSKASKSRLASKNSIKISQKSNIFQNTVKRIRDLKRLNRDWLIQVEFQDPTLEREWISRRIVYAVCPNLLLKLYRTRQQEKEKNNAKVRGK